MYQTNQFLSNISLHSPNRKKEEVFIKTSNCTNHIIRILNLCPGMDARHVADMHRYMNLIQMFVSFHYYTYIIFCISLFSQNLDSFRHFYYVLSIRCDLLKLFFIVCKFSLRYLFFWTVKHTHMFIVPHTMTYCNDFHFLYLLRVISNINCRFKHVYKKELFLEHGSIFNK